MVDMVVLGQTEAPIQELMEILLAEEEEEAAIMVGLLMRPMVELVQMEL
jgi:hypothetical protein